MFFCRECYVLSGRGLCDELITHPEESCRLWRVVVCDQETSINEEAKARYGAVKNTTIRVLTPKKTNKQKCIVLQWHIFVQFRIYYTLYNGFIEKEKRTFCYANF